MDEMNEKNGKSVGGVRSAKEIAFIAVFCALLIGGQFLFSFLPGVEVVTALLVCYSYVFGRVRGGIVAVAFSLLRQLVFGFFPSVLLLYLVYYPLLAFVFGSLGKKGRRIWTVIVCALFFSTLFTGLDNLITPLWYGYSKKAALAYMVASLPVMGMQMLCSGVTVGVLFVPLTKAFLSAAKSARLPIAK